MRGGGSRQRQLLLLRRPDILRRTERAKVLEGLFDVGHELVALPDDLQHAAGRARLSVQLAGRRQRPRMG